MVLRLPPERKPITTVRTTVKPARGPSTMKQTKIRAVVVRKPQALTRPPRVPTTNPAKPKPVSIAIRPIIVRTPAHPSMGDMAFSFNPIKYVKKGAKAVAKGAKKVGKAHVAITRKTFRVAKKVGKGAYSAGKYVGKKGYKYAKKGVKLNFKAFMLLQKAALKGMCMMPGPARAAAISAAVTASTSGGGAAAAPIAVQTANAVCKAMRTGKKEDMDAAQAMVEADTGVKFEEKSLWDRILEWLGLK